MLEKMQSPDAVGGQMNWLNEAIEDYNFRLICEEGAAARRGEERNRAPCW
jgi:hypothetical protein